MTDNSFKWNNDFNSNNNDFFNNTQQLNFNNNNNFDLDILPNDDIQDDLFHSIISKQNNNNNTNSDNNNNFLINTHSQYQQQPQQQQQQSQIQQYQNDFEMDHHHHHHHQQQQQQLQQHQMEDEQLMVDENQFNDIFNDKNNTDDSIYHNTLENEMQPKSIDPQLIPIELSNTFLKLSQAKINSINNDENNKLFYITTNRKQKEIQLKNYQMEKDTWTIINKLYTYRDIQRDIDQNEKIEISQPTSQIQVYQFLIKKNFKLRENSILLEWLEEMASQIEYNDDQVFWEHTLNQLKKGSSNGLSMLTGKFVTELDADSQSRQNKSIDKDDEKNQNKFLQSVWSFLRAGDRIGAAEYCASVGQFWRAQTLIGLNYYSGEHEIGNPYFNLWKSNCLNISKHSNDAYERAIYGLLSGNLDATLPIQKNWYDYFWCYLRVLYDETLYRELKPYRSPLSIEEDIDSPPSSSISQINTPKDILEILKNNTTQIEIKNQSENPYHIIQELIINDDYNLLFENLPNLLLKNKTPEFNRFAVLLILFFRKRESYVSTSNSRQCPENIVINEYVQYLIHTQQFELVALYTSLLNNEDLQVEVYSKFLVDIIDQNQRQQCLVLAERFGLNTQEIAQSVVKTITQGNINTVSNSFENMEFAGFSTLKQQNLAITSSSSSAATASSTNMILNINGKNSGITTPEDYSKIDSIKWLCFDKQLLIKALLQVNLLIRDFIKSNKYIAAGELLQSLPKDIIPIAKQQSPLNESDTNNIIREFRDWENFINANTLINRWIHNNYKEPKVDGGALSSFKLTGQESYAERLDIERRRKDFEDAFNQWNQKNINLGKDAISAIRLVLKTGWLCPSENQLGIFSLDDESGKEVTLLRKAIIPALFSSYNHILVGTGSLQKSSQLCNLISSEKYRWYSVFSKKELQELLNLIRESSIKLLSHNQ